MSRPFLITEKCGYNTGSTTIIDKHGEGGTYKSLSINTVATIRVIIDKH